MDETIGAKGGHNDRRKTLLISKKQKEKLKEYNSKEEIKKLEKEVKKKQIYTLIKSLPIAIGGTTFKTIYDTATDKKEIDKEEEYSKWRIKEYDADFTTKARNERKIVVVQVDGRKVVVNIPIEEKKTSKFLFIKEEEKQEEKSTKKDISIIKEKSIKKGIDNSIPIVEETIDKKEEILPKEKENSNIEFNSLTEKQREKLYKLQTRKIIGVYEKQLKDIRYDIKKLIFDYNVLVDDEKDIITSKEATDILDRLSDVIYKLEKLKERIRIENLDKYDDNYIYTLIEDYLLEFKDKRVVEEIKESPLYILISEKLEELDNKKEKLKDKLEDKKEKLEEKEENFELLRKKYYQIDKINKELLIFQNEQDMYFKEIREKVKNAVNVQEKVEIEMEAMSRQSRRLLRKLTFAMLFPGPKSAKGIAGATALYLNFAKQLLNPKTTTKKYRVITVKDYSKDIEYSIKTISDSIDLLNKTDKQIDSLISKIKSEFKDYIGTIPECDQLLSNLEKVKSELHEKEYEMQKIKREQEKELEKNDSKVLTRGTYKM